MKKVAVYPGTFDPITFGHIDVIKKALKLFNKVIIAASEGTNKNYLFNSLERIQLIKKALFVDLKFDKKNHYISDSWEKIMLSLDDDQLKDINYFNEEVPLNSEILLEYAEKYSNFKEPFDLKKTFPDYANHTVEL